MSFALLQKACDGCKASSVKTYWANIKSLSRLAGHDAVPAGASWLNDKLLKRVLAEPTNRAKRFTTAGVKAAQMYKARKEKWTIGGVGQVLEGSTDRQEDEEGGSELARGGLQSSEQVGPGPALGTAAPGKQEDVEHEGPVPLPTVPYCSIL